MLRGVASLLSEAGWTVLDGADAQRPDVIVWDFPSTGSVSDVALLRDAHGQAPLLAIVGSASAAFLAELVAAGAAGAVDRDADEPALLLAVRAVAEGRVIINAGPGVPGGLARPPELTRREAQVLDLLCAGRTNHEIAEALVISDNTVKNHVRRLYEKLQVRSRTEAVVLAARTGLVRIQP